VVSVPLGPLPAPPETVAVTHDETQVSVTWDAGGGGRRFLVLRSASVFDPATAAPLTPEPVGEPVYREPVQFGAEVCYAVVAVEGVAPAVAESSPSAVRCLVPRDTYPPAAPTGLQVLAEADAATLVWSAVEAADLGGYIVLRSESGSTNLQPLFREPIAATTYRDTAVSPGATYTYAVYAVDRSTPANVSQLSSLQTVTIR
jgi:hypothetical protein